MAAGGGSTPRGFSLGDAALVSVILLLSLGRLASTALSNVNASSSTRAPGTPPPGPLLHLRTTKGQGRAAGEDALRAVRGLLGRVVPGAADAFVLEVIPRGAAQGDEFEVGDGADGQVVLRGTDAISLCSALHWYLKYSCNASISWTGDRGLDALTRPLPPVATADRGVRRRRLVPVSYYMNTVTASYSMVWWRWERWEREIDWMALNSINLPLAMTGQEYVWEQVYAKLGIASSDLVNFFTGPAFQAWGRMGNLKAFGGPLPGSWRSQQFDLQRRILARMRDLGMTPVMPAFAGHVPGAFKAHFPQAAVTSGSRWKTFGPDECCVDVLEPTDPMFSRVGALFVQEQARLLGTDHVYACDVYNENTPPSRDPAYLRTVGRAIYDAMSAGDPEAVWVQQGWFQTDRWWDGAATAAFLSGPPPGRLLMLDLYSELQPFWAATDNYYGRPWVWCMLHNFGGTMGLYGDLSTIARGPYAAHVEAAGTMTGLGATMEGIGTNYVVYDLMLETPWRAEPANVTAWLGRYAGRRYGGGGAAGANATRAWEILHGTSYGHMSGRAKKSLVESRPTLTTREHFSLDEGFLHFGGAAGGGSGGGGAALALGPTDRGGGGGAWSGLHAAAEPAVKGLWEALALLLSSEAALGTPEGYIHDVRDVAREVICRVFEAQHGRLVAAFGARPRDPGAVAAEGRRLLEVISDLDALMLTGHSTLLGAWVAAARSWGVTKEEADLYEYNARNQLTLWGPRGEIRDYGSKQWAGLIGVFYRGRWAVLTEHLAARAKDGGDFNATAVEEAVAAFEMRWVGAREPHAPMPSGDTLAVARGLVRKYRDFGSGGGEAGGPGWGAE